MAEAVTSINNREEHFTIVNIFIKDFRQDCLACLIFFVVVNESILVALQFTLVKYNPPPSGTTHNTESSFKQYSTLAIKAAL